MTQTVDVGERSSQLDSSGAMDASTSATHRRAKVRTFAFTFGIAFTLLYTVLERLNWPLFTYQPAAGKLYFWLRRPVSGEGPPMYWYGWIVNAAIAAFTVAWIATIISGSWLRRATVFCCALAALWPAALAGLRIYITDWATFDADFLNSVWVAAPPAFVGAAVITFMCRPNWRNARGQAGC